MDIGNKLVTKKDVTEYTSRHKCGCVTHYMYPNCTKQDFVHGGCIESCACWKYKIVEKKCEKHTT